MQTRQANILQAFRGVQEFLDAHARTLGAAATSGARKKLDALLDEGWVHALTQSKSALASQCATKELHALRTTLVYDHLVPLARTAAVHLPHSPALLPFKMPRAESNAEVMYAAAMAMGDAAEPYAAVFTATGLPKHFIARLRAAADAMVVLLDTREEIRGVGEAATQKLVEAVSSARKTVRVLDAFVRRALKDDPGLLAKWVMVKRPSTPTPTPCEGVRRLAA